MLYIFLFYDALNKSVGSTITIFYFYARDFNKQDGYLLREVTPVGAFVR